jgi:prepilin-type N-terminal cleavage/methylation domain-containing protein
MPVQQTNTRVEKRARQRGFSILEMLIASVILMVGIIGVAQLGPASLQLNASNRYDTLATVIAQRELDQMLAQPIDVNTFTDSSGNLVSLGGAGSPGAPVIMQGQMAQIDFTASPVAGFSISSYMDPNDPNFPNGAVFELRWAVIPQVSGGRVISRRIILGSRQTNATQPMLPVNLDSWKFRGD